MADGKMAEWQNDIEIFSHHERLPEKEKEKGLMEQKVYSMFFFFFTL